MQALGIETSAFRVREKLTQQEKRRIALTEDCMELLGQGYTQKQVADRLRVSLRSIERYVAAARSSTAPGAGTSARR